MSTVKRKSVIGLCVSMLLMLSIAYPLAAKINFTGDSKEPIEITADVLDVFQDKNLAVFSGAVKAVQGNVNLSADRMTVTYRAGNEASEGLSRISRIDVIGNVLLTTPEETARGQKGIYYVDQTLVRLLGGVVLTRGKNVIRGDGLEYNMATGRSKIVSLPGKRDGVSASQTKDGGRVRGLFVPDSQ